MPIYEFQCECGVKFEKLYKRVSTAEDSAPCPDCGKPSRKLVSAGNFAFKHSASQTRGIAPPSTGTSDDWNYDKAIGRDAAQRWEAIEKRNKEKDRIVRQEREAGRGVTRDHLVPTSEKREDYRVIKDSERQVVNANREKATEARKHLPPPPPIPSGE